MADLTAICNGLATVLGQIPGLRVSPTFAAQVNPPAAIIMPVPQQSLHFDTFDGGVTYALQIMLLVSYVEDASSLALMHSYLATTGTNSIAQVIRNNPRLAGVYDYIVMESVRGYGLKDWAGQQYLGATATLTVMAATP